MAMLPEVFNAEEAEDASFSVLPAGWYVASIIKSQLKDTSTGGTMLALQYKIIEGEYAKRIVFGNYNIVNKSDVAVRMAKSDLKKICAAMDIESIVETEDVLGGEMQIKLTTRAATAKYPETNDIKDYRSAEAVIESEDDDSPFD